MLPLLSAILVGTSHQHAVQRVVRSPTLQQPPPTWVTESRDTPQANEASHDPRANDEASHDPRANGAAGPNSAAPPLALSEAGEDDIGGGGRLKMSTRKQPAPSVCKRSRVTGPSSSCSTAKVMEELPPRRAKDGLVPALGGHRQRLA